MLAPPPPCVVSRNQHSCSQRAIGQQGTAWNISSVSEQGQGQGCGATTKRAACRRAAAAAWRHWESALARTCPGRAPWPFSIGSKDSPGIVIVTTRRGGSCRWKGNTGRNTPSKA